MSSEIMTNQSGSIGTPTNVRMQPARRATRGFTLVELAITLVIAAILTALAWPNFRIFMQRNVVTAQTNQVVASVQDARNTAVSSHYRTGMCVSSNDVVCSAVFNNGLEQGWLVYRSGTVAGNGEFYTAGVDELLRAVQAQNNASIRIFQAGAAHAVNVINFDQRGRVMDLPTVSFFIVICAKEYSTDPIGENTTHVPGNYVRIDPSGRVAVGALSAGASCNVSPPV